MHPHTQISECKDGGARPRVGLGASRRRCPEEMLGELLQRKCACFPFGALFCVHTHLPGPLVPTRTFRTKPEPPRKPPGPLGPLPLPYCSTSPAPPSGFTMWWDGEHLPGEDKIPQSCSCCLQSRCTSAALPSRLLRAVLTGPPSQPAGPSLTYHSPKSAYRTLAVNLGGVWVLSL